MDGKGEPGLFFNDNSVTKSLRKGLQAKLRRTAIPTETTTSDVTSGSFSIKLPQSRLAVLIFSMSNICRTEFLL